MEGLPDRLGTKATYLTTQVANHARRLVNDAFAAADARGYHYRLLAALEQFGPQSQAELGRGVGVDRSDVVAAVNELEARGQVERRADPDDKRRNVVHLTTAGRRQLRRLDRELARAQELFLAPLPARDHAAYLSMLTTMLEHHGGRGQPE